jgi:MEMO1 family protein
VNKEERIREAFNAGHWYPSNPQQLRMDLTRYIGSTDDPAPAYGIIAPHAGYVYSGAVAGKTYAQAAITGTVVVITTSHILSRHKASIWQSGWWQTPLGDIKIDESMASELLEHVPEVTGDTAAHRGHYTLRGWLADHSLEIQLPFIKHLRDEAQIVPISLAADKLREMSDLGAGVDRVHGAGDELAWLIQFGHILAKIIQARNEPILIVASSDMNHFKSWKETKRRDQIALDRILALDPAGLYCMCGENSISMCGAAAAVVMLAAVKALGASKVELIEHTSSAQVTGDYDSVVGYAGVVVR